MNSVTTIALTLDQVWHLPSLFHCFWTTLWLSLYHSHCSCTLSKVISYFIHIKLAHVLDIWVRSSGRPCFGWLERGNHRFSNPIYFLPGFLIGRNWWLRDRAAKVTSKSRFFTKLSSSWKILGSSVATMVLRAACMILGSHTCV